MEQSKTVQTASPERNEVDALRNQIHNNGVINNTNVNEHKQILNDLRSQQNALQDATVSGFQYFNNKTRFINDKPPEEPSRFQNISQNINFQNLNDNIDTPTNGGSDDFISDGEPKPDYKVPEDTLSNYSEPSFDSDDDRYVTPLTTKNLNENDFKTDPSNTPIINRPRKDNINRLQRVAKDLKITEAPYTNTAKSLNRLIDDRMILNELKTQYEGLGGNDTNFLNSLSISEVRKEVKALEGEKKKSTFFFIKQPKQPLEKQPLEKVVPNL